MRGFACADDDDRDGVEDARDKARGPQQPAQQAPQGHRPARVAQAARARLMQMQSLRLRLRRSLLSCTFFLLLLCSLTPTVLVHVQHVPRAAAFQAMSNTRTISISILQANIDVID